MTAKNTNKVGTNGSDAVINNERPIADESSKDASKIEDAVVEQDKTHSKLTDAKNTNEDKGRTSRQRIEKR